MEWLGMLREWGQRLGGVLHFGRCDLEEELRLHIDLAADEARRRGIEDDPMRLWRVRAGGEAQAMDLLRDQRSLPWLEDLLTLAKPPRRKETICCGPRFEE